MTPTLLRLPMLSRLHLVCLLVLGSAPGCGDDDDDATVDGGEPEPDAAAGTDAGPDAGVDAGEDAGVDAGEAAVTFTGRVLGEEVDEVAPPLEGAAVAVVDAGGAVLDSAETDATGAYEMTALASDVAFLVVDPVEGYAGQIRSAGSRDGLAFYDAVLQLDSGLEESYGFAGLTPDLARGTIVVGFNPVSAEAGGEGATLDPPTEHEPAFVVIEDGVSVGDVLPPVCPNTGAVPCVDVARSNNLFIPNVEAVDDARLTLIQPDAGTCAPRFEVSAWLVRPHSSTIIDVDCLP